MARLSWERLKAEAAQARTTATPLAGSSRLQPAVSPEPLHRTAYVPVRQGPVGEYLDMLALARTREGAQNIINERQRVNAIALRRGAIDAYVRVACVQIREIEEPA